MKIFSILFLMVLELASQEVDSELDKAYKFAVDEWYNQYSEQEVAMTFSTHNPLAVVVNKESEIFTLTLSLKKKKIPFFASLLKSKWVEAGFFQRIRIEVMLAHLVLADAKVNHEDKNHNLDFHALRRVGITMREIYFSPPE